MSAPPALRSFRGASTKNIRRTRAGPISRTASRTAAFGRNIDRCLYLIMNNDLASPYDPIQPRIADIRGAAVSSLIRGSGTGDLYRLYLTAERDDIAFKVGWIPARVPCPDPQETFDPAFMRCLYSIGADLFRSDELWRELPPYYLLEP